jgi:hypothetical protein
MTPCPIDVVEAEVATATVGWVESLRIVVRGEPGCRGVEFVARDGVRLIDWRGKVVSAAGRSRALDPARVEVVSASPDGERTYRVHLEDLDGGGLAELRVVRLHDRPGDLTWRPAEWGAAAASLRLVRGLTPAAVTGLGLDGRWYFTASVEPSDHAVLPHPWSGDAPPRVPGWTERRDLSLPEALSTLAGLVRAPTGLDGDAPLSGEPALARGAVDARGAALTLVSLTAEGTTPVQLDGDTPMWDGAPVALPDGAPSAALRWSFQPTLDRRAATLTHRLTASRDPGPTAAVAFLRLPPETAARVLSDGVDWRLTDAALWLALPPGVPEAVIELTEPLRDAWGELPVPAVLSADADPAFVQDRAGQWRVTTFGDRPGLTDRARLVEELERRRLLASFPEPALPLGARRLVGWDLAASLPAVLADRAATADLAQVPGRLRPLYRARRSGLLSEAEAAAILTVYARQARLEADTLLVHPGDPAPVDPSGYVHALSRVRVGDEVRWLDPGCVGCAPFEVRPTLWGRPALGAIDATPSVEVTDGLPAGIVRADGRLGWSDLPPGTPPGAWIHIVVNDQSAAWTLRGAAAIAATDARARGQTPADVVWTDAGFTTSAVDVEAALAGWTPLLLAVPGAVVIDTPCAAGRCVEERLSP